MSRNRITFSNNRSLGSLSDLVLAIALGTGSLTSFRLGLVGISEVFFVIYLLINSALFFDKKNFSFFGFQGITLFYLLFSIFIILPVISLTAFLTTNYYCNPPIYVVGYWLGALVFLVSLRLIADGALSMERVVYIASILFIVLNLAAFLFLHQGGRFFGFSDNPNQILVQGTSLILLASLFLEGLKKFIILAVIFYLLILSKSDAFILFIAVFCGSFILLKGFNIASFSRSLKITLASSSVVLILTTIYLVFGDSINLLLEVVSEADQGSGRTNLFYNASAVVKDYPLFGLGSGSFSGGRFGPYDCKEAHNTFLDFSMQLGIIFALVLYLMFFRALFLLISEGNLFPAAILCGYLLITQIHFFGRHIIFWLILSIIFVLIFRNENHRRYT